MRSLLLCALVMFLILTFHVDLSRAQYIVNGAPVCKAVYDQDMPRIVSDGANGAFITWFDLRDGTVDIYVQRIGPDGYPYWTENGVAVCTAAEDQMYPDMVSDGSGGVIIVWQDEREKDTSGFDIYAQRIDRDANMLWRPDGKPVLIASGDQVLPYAMSDGAGGAFIMWWDEDGDGRDSYAQRIDRDGFALWGGGGVAVGAGPGDQMATAMMSDGAGGIFLGWQYRPEVGDDLEVFVQRVDSNGNVLWAADGVSICDAPGIKGGPVMCTDGGSGAIVVWPDQRVDEGDVYAQRITSSGDTLWAKNGVPICTAPGLQAETPVVPDGEGGAIIAWWDIRSGTIQENDIYAQRIDSLGVAQWADNGVAVSAARNGQLNPRLMVDGAGGAFVAWSDGRTPPHMDVYAQRIDAAGNMLWTPDGLPVCMAAGDQVHIDMTTDGAGGIILTWRDRRDAFIDIYAARIDGDGYRIATHLQYMASYIGESSVTLEWTLSDPEPRVTFVVVRHDVTRSETVVIDEPEIVRDGTLYIFEDTGLSPGTTYRYRVDSEDGGGRHLLFETDYLTVPEMAVTLYQNHPNPFNPSTTIRFHLPDAQRVILTIHDISGKRIATLVDEFGVKGFHVVDWNGTSDDGAPVESGVYFFRLNAGKTRLSRKMILLK